MPAINSIRKPKIFGVVAYVLQYSQNLVISRCCLQRTATKCIKIYNARAQLNSHRMGLVHQHGRRLIVLEHQYGCHDVMCILSILGTLRKTRRQQQRERQQTKGLIAVHVSFNSWYISLPFPAKQQREMTKFCVVWRT